MNLFQKMQQQGMKPDEVTWNTLISAYSYHGDTNECMYLFEKMQRQGMKPDEFTWLTMIGACAKAASLELGKHLHRCIMDCGIRPDTNLGTSLIDMYSKSGSISEAEAVYHDIPEGARDVGVYTAMIAGHGIYGNGKEAMKIF